MLSAHGHSVNAVPRETTVWKQRWTALSVGHRHLCELLATNEPKMYDGRLILALYYVDV